MCRSVFVCGHFFVGSRIFFCSVCNTVSETTLAARVKRWPIWGQQSAAQRWAHALIPGQTSVSFQPECQSSRFVCLHKYIGEGPTIGSDYGAMCFQPSLVGWGGGFLLLDWVTKNFVESSSRHQSGHGTTSPCTAPNEYNRGCLPLSGYFKEVRECSKSIGGGGQSFGRGSY